MTTPEQQALLDDLISHLDDAATRVKALIAENLALKAELERVKAERDDWGKRWHQERRKVAELRYPGMTGVVKPMAEELEAIKGAGEPVAWSVTMDGHHTDNLFTDEWRARNLMRVLNTNFQSEKRAVVPLYTRPCVPLTNEQIWSLAMPHITYYQLGEATHRDINCLELARAIEAAHNIKGAKP